MGIADRLGLHKLRAGLEKTRDELVGKVSRLLTAKSEVDDDTLEELEEVLIRADVGVTAAAGVISALEETIRKRKFTDKNDLLAVFKETLLKCLLATRSSSQGEVPSRLSSGKPHVVLLVGVNGVGKTTTLGKLAYAYSQAGKKVLIAASDTFRAAANEQLSVWAERAGANLVMQAQGADPAAVAFDALQSARASGIDILLVDTAGRLHTRVNLMSELQKISRVLAKQDPAAPHEVLLVVDASTGQNGLNQARQFTLSTGVTGLVLTKLDGTAKGGIVFAICSELGIPVRYVGVGEGPEDLQDFDGEAFVEALFAP